MELILYTVLLISYELFITATEQVLVSWTSKEPDVSRMILGLELNIRAKVKVISTPEASKLVIEPNIMVEGLDNLHSLLKTATVKAINISSMEELVSSFVVERVNSSLT